MWCDSTEKEPLEQRFIQYTLNKKISSYVKEGVIAKAKGLVTTNDVIGLIMRYIEQIFECIETKTNLAIESKDFIVTDSQTIEEILDYKNNNLEKYNSDYYQEVLLQELIDQGELSQGLREDTNETDKDDKSEEQLVVKKQTPEIEMENKTPMKKPKQRKPVKRKLFVNDEEDVIVELSE